MVPRTKSGIRGTKQDRDREVGGDLKCSPEARGPGKKGQWDGCRGTVELKTEGWSPGELEYKGRKDKEA